MLNNSDTTVQRGQGGAMIGDPEGRAENLPAGQQSPTGINGYVRSILAKPRTGSLLVYAMSALGLAVICVLGFNALEHDTEFAIAVMGSLIGGFLGALLAAALIVDIHMSKRDRNTD